MIDLKERSKLVQGLMRVSELDSDKIKEIIEFDLKNNINFFDTADIYDNTKSESKLGEVLKNNSELREKMFIQTKCGISENEHGKKYDLSYEYIVQHCYDSLKRLNTNYIDSYLLHRLDLQMDANEVYKAYKYLKDKKMIRYFGVSNFTPNAIQYLLDNKVEILTNQVQLGLGQTNILNDPICFNNSDNVSSSTFDILFYLKNKNIELQCWSPYQYKFFQGSIFKQSIMKNCIDEVDKLAIKYNASRGSIVTSFLFNIWNKVFVITGDVNKERIKEAYDGVNIKLTKEEFYSLYTKANNILY